MLLRSIKLTNFKNNEATNLRFSKPISVFVGNNGEGKTNLLDAVYMVCYGKSYFSSREVHILRHGSEFYRLEALVEVDNRTDKVVIKYNGTTKSIEVDGVEVSGMVEYLGKYPVAMMCPADIELVYGGSEVRRRFMDQVLSQSDRNYLQALIHYNRVLKQRNTFLKSKFTDRSAAILMAAWNKQLSEFGTQIFQKREAFIQYFKSCFEMSYGKVAAQKDQIILSYASQLNDASFEKGLSDSWEKDKLLRRTTFGIHKDDLVLSKDGYPVSREGSQGQVKSAVLALKLGQIIYLREHLHSNPLIILDDIFDKLDPGRIRNLIEEMVHVQKCQLFISDAFKLRLADILDDVVPGGYEIWTVNQGKVTPI